MIFPINPSSAWSIALWKVAPNFFKPKGIQEYAYVSHGAMKDVLGMSSSTTRTWSYPENPSDIDIQSYPVTCWRRNYMLGRGKLSFTLDLLRSLKSTHIWISQYFSSQPLDLKANQNSWWDILFQLSSIFPTQSSPTILTWDSSFLFSAWQVFLFLLMGWYAEILFYHKPLYHHNSKKKHQNIIWTWWYIDQPLQVYNQLPS